MRSHPPFRASPNQHLADIEVTDTKKNMYILTTIMALCMYESVKFACTEFIGIKQTRLFIQNCYKHDYLYRIVINMYYHIGAVAISIFWNLNTITTGNPYGISCKSVCIIAVLSPQAPPIPRERMV